MAIMYVKLNSSSLLGLSGLLIIFQSEYMLKMVLTFVRSHFGTKEARNHFITRKMLKST